MKNLKKYIKEQLNTALESMTIAHPETSKQLSLNFKSNPVDTLTKFIEEKEDELQNDLAHMEMLLDANGIKSTQAIKLLNILEA